MYNESHKKVLPVNFKQKINILCLVDIIFGSILIGW